MLPGVLASVFAWQDTRSLSRLEFRQEGLTLVTFGRRQEIPWSDVSRVDIDDVEFPKWRGRGPCLVLVFPDGRRKRLWMTEQWQWGYDRRLEALQQMAEQFRSIRREIGTPHAD